MRVMYDSVDASAIPADAELVAGYVDGRYAWSAADWARFPNAIKVRIAVFPWTNDGDVLDCEPGDATVADCPGWIRMRQAAGLAVPTIYCSVSDIPNVQAACAGLTYDIWSAHYTGVPHIDQGAVATQYADPAMGAGGHYDVSLVSDEWPRGEDVSEPIPQDYKDKFGEDVTWQGVADNLEGIISSLISQIDAQHEAVNKLDQIKEIVDA